MKNLPSTRIIPLKAFPGVWLKCEHENPSGSHKDRAYAQMISILGPLSEKTCLVDYTTGNGGISLALFARDIGRPAVVFMPRGMTPERGSLIQHHGAELVETPADRFVAGSREAAERYVRKHPSAVLLSQSDNLANQRGFHKVGQEIVDACRRLELAPRLFVCAVGTGGAFSGIAHVLKSELRELRAIAIEVPEAPMIWAQRHQRQVTPERPSIIGMGPGAIALNTDLSLVDDVELVAGDRVHRVMAALQAVDGLDIGPSSAANVLVASKFAQKYREPVLTITFDRGDRYGPRRLI